VNVLVNMCVSALSVRMCVYVYVFECAC
jgi:hypothetical protein